MDKLVELPEHVCFKGDNGMYLRAKAINGLPYLQFSADDIGDPRVMHTIHPYRYGLFRIKSAYFDKFWRRGPTNWIYADSDDGDTTVNGGKDGVDRDTLFSAVKLGDGTFALQSLGNYLYCTSLTTDGKENCLNASDEATIKKSTNLRLEEAVVSRRIYDVRYDTNRAKIHGYRDIVMVTREAVNDTDTADTPVMDLKFRLTKERKWDSGVSSLKLGRRVKTTNEAGFVLEVATASSVRLQEELTESYNWGESNAITEEHDLDGRVSVPPNTMLIVSVVATIAACEVPFSYWQEDVLTSGKKVVRKFEDGIYRGVNGFAFRMETSEQKL